MVSSLIARWWVIHRLKTFIDASVSDACLWLGPLWFNIWAAICEFQQCGILTGVDADKSIQPPFKLRTPNYVQSVAEHSYNIQANSNGSDQTARMRRLIWDCWSHIPHCWQSHIAAQLCVYVCSKESSYWDSSFEYPQHMFKQMGKKILRTVLVVK